MPKNFRLFDINEVAEMLGRNQSWVRKVIYAGVLKTVGGSSPHIASFSGFEHFSG